jgi:hypothetical protein
MHTTIAEHRCPRAIHGVSETHARPNHWHPYCLPRQGRRFGVTVISSRWLPEAMMGSESVDVGDQLITSARMRGGELLRTLGNSPAQPLDVALERAAGAVQQYCAQLIDDLVASLPSNSPSDLARVKSRYTEVVLKFAQSVRDLEPDPDRRHEIAQAVQFKILQSERRLRSLLNALAPSLPANSDG